MDSRKIVLKETTIIAVGELVFSAIMIAVYAALDRFTMKVLWSALAGSLIMTINFFAMSVTVNQAADQARQGYPEQGSKMVRTSSAVRLLVMAVAVLIGVKLGGDVVALALPLAFARPTLMLSEFFRKKGD